MIPTSEQSYLATHGPAAHARTAAKVELCMQLAARPCTGNGCDELACPRHSRSPLVAERFAGLVERWRRIR